MLSVAETSVGSWGALDKARMQNRLDQEKLPAFGR